MLVRAGPIRDEYWSLSRPMRAHLARSAMTAAHHTPRTRPPLLAPVLAIVTPHSSIAVVLISSIYYIYYLLRTPEPEQEHLQQIRYLNSLILRTNRISSSFTAVETQTSHHQTFWLRCSPILIHYLVRYQILHTSLAGIIINSIHEQGRCEEYVHV